MELEHGVFENDTGHENDQCVVINRNIGDLDSNVEDDRADEYIDVIDGKPRRIKRPLKQKMDSLRDEEIPELVGVVIYIVLSVVYAMSVSIITIYHLYPGPNCSKLTMSLVNDSLKFTLSDTQIC